NWSIDQYNYNPNYPYAGAQPRKDFAGRVDTPGGIAAAPFVMDAQVNAYAGDYPMFAWGLNDPVGIAANWDPYYIHMFRHHGTTANMLYLDGHVAPIKSILDGTPTYTPIYYNSP